MSGIVDAIYKSIGSDDSFIAKAKSLGRADCAMYAGGVTWIEDECSPRYVPPQFRRSSPAHDCQGCGAPVAAIATECSWCKRPQ